MTLHFNFYDNLKFFKVEFETESRQRNRPMNIELDGFNLDICDLISMHYDLYVKIENEIRAESKKYWDGLVNDHALLADRQIKDIPTLAYQNKAPLTTKAIDSVIKAFMPVIILFLIPVFSFAQGFMGMEVINHGFGVNGGYIVSNVQIKVGLNSGFSHKAGVPNMVYASGGYQVTLTNNDENNFSIIPSAGIASYHVTDLSSYHSGGDAIDINKTALLTSIELGKDFTLGNEGRYYIFYTHAIQSFFGAGLKIYIK
jgi:hypothetical protein